MSRQRAAADLASGRNSLGAIASVGSLFPQQARGVAWRLAAYVPLMEYFATLARLFPGRSVALLISGSSHARGVVEYSQSNDTRGTFPQASVSLPARPWRFANPRQGSLSDFPILGAQLGNLLPPGSADCEVFHSLQRQLRPGGALLVRFFQPGRATLTVHRPRRKPARFCQLGREIFHMFHNLSAPFVRSSTPAWARAPSHNFPFWACVRDYLTLAGLVRRNLARLAVCAWCGGCR